MQITVYGASGKVGRLVVAEALRRNYTVIAFVHEQNPFSNDDKLQVRQGDVYKNRDITLSLVGSEAVISCLGSWGTKQRNVVTTAMRALIPAMEAAGITRIITLTGSGAIAPGEVDTLAHKAVMLLAKPFPAYKVFRDGEEHMKLLAQSSLEWTTIRSPVMTNGAEDTYLLSHKMSGPLATISRRAVATAMVDQLELQVGASHVRSAPIIRRADTSSFGHLPKV